MAVDEQPGPGEFRCQRCGKNVRPVRAEHEGDFCERRFQGERSAELLPCHVRLERQEGKLSVVLAAGRACQPSTTQRDIFEQLAEVPEGARVDGTELEAMAPPAALAPAPVLSGAAMPARGPVGLQGAYAGILGDADESEGPEDWPEADG